MQREQQRIPRRAQQALKASGCYATDLPRTVAAALADHALILLLAAAGYAGWLYLPEALALFAHALVFLGVVRCQRGLECLVHEGAHYNWARRRRLNDLLVNALAALPVFSTVAAFRTAHKRHHEQFGTPEDPDRKRYYLRTLDGLDRSSWLPFLKGVLARLGPYALDWWRAVGSGLVALALGLAWHALVVVLPLGALLGWHRAAWLWGVYYLLPLVFFLPLLRFIAEAGEHVYAEARSVLDATVSNLGWGHRWLIHPHGDGFHLLHHLCPAVPHHRLRRAHDILAKLDPEGYGRRHRCRTRILQEPEAAEGQTR
jgi:fatty acid desaturase